MDEHAANEQLSHEEKVTRAGNPARPEGQAGSEMLERMNRSHAGVTDWALDGLSWAPTLRTLDIGCGGGATMRRLARRMGLVDADGIPITAGTEPSGHVTGVDYSSVSCEMSRAFNAKAIKAGLMDVVEASVEKLPFPDASFDLITTVESFYFWPNPLHDLREVCRVLRPGGTFLLVADVYQRDDLSEDTLDNIQCYSLTVLDPDTYRTLFAKAGFSNPEVRLKEGTSWICVTGGR